MWSVRAYLALAIVGCGSGKHDDADAPVAEIDAMIDGPTACQPKVLLAGGSDVGPQGWSVDMQPPATMSYGPDYVQLVTSTANMATTSGMLLLHYPGAVEVGKPFKIQVVMRVKAVNPHNQFDSAAAILGSFTPPYGAGNDRNEMIYLDSAALGWADDSAHFAAAIADGADHTYELAVDAAGMARLSLDGVQVLTRAGFTFNGTIAIGDQTNEAKIDSVLQIRSVTRLCP